MHNKRQRSQVLVGTLVIGAFLVFGWLLRPQPRLVEAVRVQRQTVVATVSDLGEAWVRDPFAVAAPVSGWLERVRFEVGDRVTSGQELARIRAARSTPLDPRAVASASAGVRQARAAVERARARLALARDERDRLTSLWRQGLVAAHQKVAAEQAFAEVAAAQREAEAAAQSAEALLAVESSDDGRAVPVLAPTNGVILRRFQESEGPVASATPLFEVGDPERMEIRAEFLSQDAALIPVGSSARITGWGGPPLAAHVRRVEPTGTLKRSALGVEERRVVVWLDLDEAAERLGHGFQVEASIDIARADQVLVLPLESLVRIDRGWAVWTIVEGRLQRVAVDIGLGDGEYREIRAGLAESDWVVRVPSNDLNQGDAVRVDTAANSGAPGG